MLVTAIAHIAAEILGLAAAGRNDSWHLEITLNRRSEPAAADPVPDLDPAVLASIRSISERLGNVGY